MKVLVIHNSYNVLGGEDVSTHAEVALLRLSNVEVETYYISNRDVGNVNRFRLALNAIWSFYYYRNLLKKIRFGSYDIVHVQNFFPLFSPSIFYAIKRTNARVVISVRNYRLVCPNALMYVDGSICKICVGHKAPIAGFYKKCYRNSYGASFAVVSMLTLHNYLNTWKNKIDAFICVSNFVKTQLVAGGFDETKMHIKQNFVKSNIMPKLTDGDYYIYSGRLSSEKGIDILLREFSESVNRLIIVGDGPLKGMVEAVISKQLNISYFGSLSLHDNYLMILNARALIFPARWHEPFGRTIVEAFAHGTPVIASCLGGISEVVNEGYNGFLFDPSKQGDFSRAMSLFEEVSDKTQLRRNCYDTYLRSFTPTSNAEIIKNIYSRVLQNTAPNKI